MKKLFLVLTLINSLAAAHEGHDHGPSQVEAPKGGVMRSLETVHLELLQEGKKIKIYAYDLDLKSVPVKKFPATMTVELPRKKPAPAKLVDAGDHWEVQFDAKKVHRLTLEMSIQQGGHNDHVKWVVEPKM